MKKERGYTERSLRQRLEIINKIPVYPNTVKPRTACGNNRENLLCTIGMLAEDRRSGICFVSLKDKSDEMMKTLNLLAQISAKGTVTA